MSNTGDFRTRAHTPEYIPPGKHPGHEQDYCEDPVIAARIEEQSGRERFSIGNTTGVICARGPVAVER